MDYLVKFIADWLVIIIAIAGGAAYFMYVRNDKYQRYAKAFMAGLTALVFAKILSAFYIQGDRPFVQMGVDPKAAYLNNPGFPSDHALLVFTIAFVVFAATGNRKVSLILVALAILVALGRVLALVHTPADVVGGFLAAFFGVWLWYGTKFIKLN